MRTLRFGSSILALAVGASSAPAQWSETELTVPRMDLAATSVGHRALFAGGREGSFGLDPGNIHPSAAVEIYDATLGHPADPLAWSIASLSVARSRMGATTIGDYALFAGGEGDTGASDVVDVYHAATNSWDVLTLAQARGAMAATSIGSSALFADGSVVEIYDATLGPPTDPGAWRVDPIPAGGMATAVGLHALFADQGVVQIYEGSSGTWSTYSLGPLGDLDAATSVGSKALFAFSGYCDDMYVATYDSRVGPPSLPSAWTVVSRGPDRRAISATTVGGRAVFAAEEPCCGCSDGVPARFTDVLIDQTEQWFVSDRFGGIRGQAATALEGMALFAGGLVCGPHGTGCWTVGTVGILEQHNFCSTNANSTGLAAVMTVSGTASMGVNDLSLRAEPVPDQPFLFFHGPEQQQVPFGDGFLCVGGGLTRILPPRLATGNVAERAVDLPSIGITAPGTLHFQCWYRDPAGAGALSNTSDAISVTFVP